MSRMHMFTVGPLAEIGYADTSEDADDRFKYAIQVQLHYNAKCYDPKISKR